MLWKDVLIPNGDPGWPLGGDGIQMQTTRPHFSENGELLLEP